MSKVLRLKEWVTVSEAAAHLSQSLSEPVSEADLLQLALDRKLTLSIYLPNGLGVRFWEPVEPEVVKAVFGRLPGDRELVSSEDGTEAAVFYQGRFLKLSSWHGLGYGWIENRAVLDLPMAGSETEDVAVEMQRLMGLEQFSVSPRSGSPWLANANGALYLAVDHHMPAAVDDKSFEAARFGIAVRRVVRLSAAGVFVVRPSALAEFLASIGAADNAATVNVSRPPRARVPSTALRVVAALCKEVGVDWRAREAVAVVEQLTRAPGCTPVSNDTVRSLLREIPDALSEGAG